MHKYATESSSVGNSMVLITSKVVGSTSIRATDLRAELDNLCVPLRTQNVLSTYLLHVSLQISGAKGDLQTEMTL